MNQNHSTKQSLAGFLIMAVLSLAFVAASGPLYQVLRGPVTTNQPEFPLKDGVYSYEGTADSKGFSDQVELTVKDGVITACTWDCIGADGVGKQQLSMEGLYVMTEDGPTWKAQSEALAAYVIEHQSVSQLADAQGYAKDAIAYVSINVTGFVNGINECLRQAAA